MMDDVKLTVDTLSYCEESGARCGDCPSGADEKGVPHCCSQVQIADLIESLAAELEQVKRERDAAVNDLKLWHCFSCNNKSTPYCQECSRNRVRLIKGYMSGRDHYEWRGVKEEV